LIPELHSKVRMAAKAHPEYTLKEIGNLFGLTRQRIHQVIKEIGPHNYKLKQKGCKRKVVLSKLEIQTAIKTKIRQDDFIRQHSTSLSTLKYFLDMYGLVWPKRIHNEKIKLNDLKEMIRKHPDYCLRELAAHFKVTASAISNRIRYHDLPYLKKKN